ncbi:MAG: bifunctional phosphopantothenoylcysteine decarboxylase/phosphopantothenate--cysteine ligase CoaBC [Anaerolineales bacterium]
MPNPVESKSILLGVTGSIAAYKAADVASKLHQMGANVTAILTQSAMQFITPLTFQSVTGCKAYTDADLWGGEGHVTHIGLARSADFLVIAPASANTIAKLAHGISDNLLTVTALAAGCPILIAPAMDAGMYSHPATKENVDILCQRGAVVIGPESGHLASGLTGVGRMTEPEKIIAHVRYLLSRNGPLKEKRIVVTAGGTREPIDPVRVIANRSSGRQGYAIAQAAMDAGADVTLITAPTHLEMPVGCRVISVTTAREMLQQVLSYAEGADVLIMAAAVADFRPRNPAGQKIKKHSNLLVLDLEPTEDILAAVANMKAETGFPLRTIGFAAESENLIQNARGKLEAKRLDMIIANDISAPNAGFEVETNRVTLLFADGHHEELPLMTKLDVAERIIQQVIQWL